MKQPTKPSYTQLETLRDISKGKRWSGIAERFAQPLIRNGWAKDVASAFDRCGSLTLRIQLVLTDAGTALVASKAGCCSRCECREFVLDSQSIRQRCTCKHYQYRHD